MTLIELVVVMSIIVLLIAMLFPVVGMLRTSSATANARHLVLSVGMALRAYADEDPRHFYPTPLSNKHLTYDSTDPDSILLLLEKKGYQVPFAQIDPGTKELIDEWGRPICYALDGPYRSGGAINASQMNGTADRPAADPTWNPKGQEPWAYVWSLGKPTKNGDAADALSTNAAAWIFEKGTP